MITIISKQKKKKSKNLVIQHALHNTLKLNQQFLLTKITTTPNFVY